MKADEGHATHLDDEQLASYVDGALGADERAAVELHMSSCARCRSLFAEAVQTVEGLEADQPAQVVQLPRRSRWVRWAVAGGGLAAAAAIVLAVWAPRGERPVGADRSRLVEAMGQVRVFEPRLVGGFAHADVQQQFRGESRDWPTAEIRIALGEYQKALGEDVSSQAAYGAAALVAGEVDLAVRTLDQASKSAPDDAAVLTDYSAALLVQHSRDTTRYAGNLSAALEAAERAVRLYPASPEAQFNRALALEGLGALNTAIKAWEAYVSVEADVRWRNEGEQHLARLRNRQQSHAVPPASSAPEAPWTIERAIRRELSTLANEPIDTDRHEVAERLCDLRMRLAAQWRDPRVDVADCVRVIEGSGRDWWLAARALVDGWTELERDDAERAASRFATALASAGADHHIRLDAALGRSRALLRLGDNRAASALLTGQLKDALATRRQSAEARIRLSVAYVRWQQFRPAAALRELTVAAELFEGAGDHAGGLQARRGLAECYRRLGAGELAWRQVMHALDVNGRSTALDAYLTAYEVSLLAQSSGRGLAALVLQEEALDRAKATRLEGAIGEALIRRAELHADLAEHERASADVAAARALQIVETDPYLQVELALAAARFDVPGTKERLGELMRTATRIEPHHRVRLAQARARTLRGEKLLNEAVIELNAGLEIAERLRSDSLHADVQRSYQQLIGDLLAERLSIGYERGENAADLFALLERARRLQVTQGVSEPVPVLHDVQRLLPDGSAILAFVASERFVGAFAVSRRDIWFGPLDSTLHEMMQLGEQCRTEAEASITPCQRRLGGILLAPMSALGGQVARLIVMPDGPVRRVSFAALPNPSTGRPLIEDVRVSYATSATSLRRRSMHGAGGEPRSVVVGYGGVPPAFPHLRPLRLAEREAATVAATYPAARLIIGAEATVSRVTAALQGITVLHFAGHALASRDSAALSALVVASNDDDGGLLTSRVFEKADLSSLRLVTLSGCGTADDAAGLSIAAVLAERGVPAIVATLWDVDDQLAHDVFTEFHRRVAESGNAVEAFATTQRQFARAHRAGWSAFVVIGAAAVESVLRPQPS